MKNAQNIKQVFTTGKMGKTVCGINLYLSTGFELRIRDKTDLSTKLSTLSTFESAKKRKKKGVNRKHLFCRLL